MPHRSSSHSKSPKRQDRERRPSVSAYANILPATAYPPYSTSTIDPSILQSGVVYHQYIVDPATITPPTQHTSNFCGNGSSCYISPASSRDTRSPQRNNIADQTPVGLFPDFVDSFQTCTPEPSPYRTRAQHNSLPLYPLDRNVRYYRPYHSLSGPTPGRQTTSYPNISVPFTTPVYDAGHPRESPRTSEARIRGNSPIYEGVPRTHYSNTYQPRTGCVDATYTHNVYQYLAGPDHTADSRRVEHEPLRVRTEHAWFDVRNITTWDGFDMATIQSIPEMTRALSQTGAMRMPAGPSNAYSGKTLLQKTISKLCVRVNEALAVVQGQPHITMMALTEGKSRFQPDFTSGYADDNEKTIENDGRRRVVGVLKASSHWSTRMRGGHDADKKRYLAGLADVHQAMRLHGTRYGFIVSELELVCVRYRASPENKKVPLFGALELSSPIAIGTSQPSSGMHLTAGVALFYLNMLAQSRPLTGQLHWKLDIRAPKEGTRKVHLARRDEWMPDVLKLEERKMMTARKWVYPKDKISRYERQLGESSKRRRR